MTDLDALENLRKKLIAKAADQFKLSDKKSIALIDRVLADGIATGLMAAVSELDVAIANMQVKIRDVGSGPI